MVCWVFFLLLGLDGDMIVMVLLGCSGVVLRYGEIVVRVVVFIWFFF